MAEQQLLFNSKLKVEQNTEESVHVKTDRHREAGRMSQALQTVDWLMLERVEWQVTDAPLWDAAGHVHHAHQPVNWLSSANHLAHQTTRSWPELEQNTYPHFLRRREKAEVSESELLKLHVPAGSIKQRFLGVYIKNKNSPISQKSSGGCRVGRLKAYEILTRDCKSKLIIFYRLLKVKQIWSIVSLQLFKLKFLW